jgi:hypothetical protein
MSRLSILFLGCFLVFCSPAYAQNEGTIIEPNWPPGDLTNYSVVTAHFLSAISQAGPHGTVFVGPGDYWFDNNNGPVIISGFSGQLIFEGSSTM